MEDGAACAVAPLGRGMLEEATKARNCELSMADELSMAPALTYEKGQETVNAFTLRFSLIGSGETLMTSRARVPMKLKNTTRGEHMRRVCSASRILPHRFPGV